VLVPGDFEVNTRTHRLANGIDLPNTIYQQLREYAEEWGVPMPEAQ
jgi:LDH2 family malate/lactate/ureidoglycolate dehydrogenase